MMLQNTHNRNKSTRTKLFVAQANKKRMEKNKRKPNRTFAIVRTKCFNQLHIAIQSIRFYCCTHAKWNEGSNEDISTLMPWVVSVKCDTTSNTLHSSCQNFPYKSISKRNAKEKYGICMCALL